MAEDLSFHSDFVDTYRIPGQYIYDDRLLLGECCRPESIARARNLSLDSRDVIVASYPKTGTTLLQEAVWLILNKVDVTRAEATYTYNRVPFIEDTARDNISIFHALPLPRCIKTHLPYDLLPKETEEKNVKIIYIYRNPRDTLVSFYHFYRATKQFGFFPGTWDQFFDMFYRVNKGMLYYGNIFDHIKTYLDCKNDNLLILSYEEMIKDRKCCIRRIAEFLNIELDEVGVEKIAEATEFKSMRKNSSTNFTNIPQEINPKISPFMRKGEIGDWVNYFSEDQIEKLNVMESEKSLGIEFVYH